LGCNRLGWSSGWQPATSAINQPHQRHQPIRIQTAVQAGAFFQFFGAKHISILM
jgi:hypothetical protein